MWNCLFGRSRLHCPTVFCLDPAPFLGSPQLTVIGLSVVQSRLRLVLGGIEVRGKKLVGLIRRMFHMMRRCNRWLAAQELIVVRPVGRESRLWIPLFALIQSQALPPNLVDEFKSLDPQQSTTITPTSISLNNKNIATMPVLTTITLTLLLSMAYIPPMIDAIARPKTQRGLTERLGWSSHGKRPEKRQKSQPVQMAQRTQKQKPTT